MPDGGRLLKHPAQRHKRGCPGSTPSRAALFQPHMHRFQRCHGQEEAEGDSHCGHNGMKKKRQHQQQRCLPSLAGKDSRNRQQNHGGCHIARMQMLIGQIQRRSRNRQGEHRAYHRHARPLRPAGQGTACAQCSSSRRESAQSTRTATQFRCGNGNSGYMNEPGHPFVELRCLKLRPEELASYG